jgi:hypothetical protein
VTRRRQSLGPPPHRARQSVAMSPSRPFARENGQAAEDDSSIRLNRIYRGSFKHRGDRGVRMRLAADAINAKASFRAKNGKTRPAGPPK